MYSGRYLFTGKEKYTDKEAGGQKRTKSSEINVASSEIINTYRRYEHFADFHAPEFTSIAVTLWNLNNEDWRAQNGKMEDNR